MLDLIDTIPYLEAFQVYFSLVVGPRAKLHLTVLLVEGEEGNVYRAGGLIDGRGNPAHLPIVEQVVFFFFVKG